MTEENDKSNLPPETQHQRWVKYGANVVLSSVVIIVLAGLLVYLAQTHDKRIDTTMGGTQSLRPQSVDFLKSLDKKIRIVAIYPRLKSDTSLSEQDYFTPVSDLLAEYSSKTPNVTTEMIDPDTDKDRFTKLVAEVTNNYGGDVKNYKAFLADVLPDQSAALVKFAADEETQFKALPLSDVKDEDLANALALSNATLVSIPRALSGLKDDIDAEESQPIPSYKDCTDETRQACAGIAQYLTLFSQVMAGVQTNKDVPQAIRDYAPGAVLRSAAANKIVTDLQDQIQKLPPLKELLEFRDQLKSKSIIILVDKSGEKASTAPSTQSDDDSNPGYKILPFASVWEPPQTMTFGALADTRPHLDFAGEQQITASIATLVSGKRPMIVFVRPGGAALTAPSQDGQDGPFASMAQRLKEYNFDVQEKDASGQSQTNPQEGAPPEPTDDQMQSAIWVVLSMPANPMMGPSPINAMLQKHLADGGSALLMVSPGSDEMADVLSPWGIAAKTSYIIAHEAASSEGRRPTDPIDAALQQNQTVFSISQYGDAPMVTPLQGLAFLLYMPAPIQRLSDTAPGVKVLPLFPMPLSPHYWGSSNAQTLIRDPDHQAKIQFSIAADPNSDHPIADLDNTSDRRLYAGAASEKSGAGRLIVVGTPYFAFSQLANIADADRPDVRRFPGNGEFFMDSIFWLSHMDSMLAISPHALEIARISDMSSASLAFWRVGVLTAGLPALVILAGIMTYIRRRD